MYLVDNGLVDKPRVAQVGPAGERVFESLDEELRVLYVREVLSHTVHDAQEEAE